MSRLCKEDVRIGTFGTLLIHFPVRGGTSILLEVHPVEDQGKESSAESGRGGWFWLPRDPCHDGSRDLPRVLLSHRRASVALGRIRRPGPRRADVSRLRRARNREFPLQRRRFKKFRPRAQEARKQPPSCPPPTIPLDETSETADELPFTLGGTARRGSHAWIVEPCAGRRCFLPIIAVQCRGARLCTAPQRLIEPNVFTRRDCTCLVAVSLVALSSRGRKSTCVCFTYRVSKLQIESKSWTFEYGHHERDD
ncbi:hypothetical protein MPTK1_6g05080 [Marchantia polymorpha subsp. ruderalis]|uniref:Uncharacterized protein n=2 Tax=Marchantia polymorpha TaxID=3197 RepID=A0AAF6BNP5_MARPO|nr:hypothetical protein MARPO_0034s0009 [Marchantia polymorpha]BBN13629.1 hypothetical protein Mp_6g05080 [Marchantia polymorpha subsp. ruderalis]|eukprot:PTQ41399.1 hypothetical protein MARPO_0034s0009 [Marchantia polymorpha]